MNISTLAPAVEICNLTRRFGSQTALAQVSLTIPRGCVFGLVGLNGAGKTTLIKHILGLFRAEPGVVTVLGGDPSRDPANVLKGIGYLTEEDSLPAWMRVGELIRFYQAFYTDWDSLYCKELLEMFELRAADRIRHLSKGQRARAGLVVALSHRPSLLVLDEPSSGLDPVVRGDILEAIVRTIAESGKTVLFSSHLLDEVQRVSDYIALLHQGRIIEANALDAVQQRYRRVTMRLEKPREGPPNLARSADWSGAGCFWTGVLEAEESEIAAHVASIGGSVEAVERVSLHDWFVSRVGHRGMQAEVQK